MNMSDDLKGKINQLLEAKPRLSFNNDGCDVLDKGGNCVRSFKQKDLGEKYKKSAEVFLAANYSKLNAEGFVWKESKLQEISKGTMGSYVKKASDDISDRAYHSGGDRQDNEFNSSEKTPERKKLLNRQKGIKTAVKKLTKESDELQELSPKTLISYRDKALKDASGKHQEAQRAYDGGNYNRADSKMKASQKRVKSMNTATDKLDKKKDEIKLSDFHKEGVVDAIKSKLHPSRPERNAASRRQDQEAAAKKAVKSAVASTVAKSLEKKQIKESNEVDSHEIEVQPETPMTNMERIAGFISAQTKVQSADGTSMMGVKKDIQEKKMSKAEFKDMMAGKGKKDKGDMDGDGKHEPDDKEYMDNKDKAIKKSMGKKGKKDEMEEAIDQKSSDPEKSIGHNCATHVEHAVYGAGECIPGMHTLDETSEGEGVVTHYDVMFKIDNEPVIKENVRVEELKIVKEMHHGHKKKK